MWQRLRVRFGRRGFEAGMNEELAFHLQQYTEDLIRDGVAPEEARRRARLEFGGVTSVQEDCREARGQRGFDELSRQIRYATRLLRKTPAFTATAIATLAICLGANLAIFAVIDSILIRSLPFPNADRLVTLYNSYPKAGVDRDGASLVNYYERRGKIAALASLSIHRRETSLVGEAGSTERILGARVSPEFFSTLGIQPVAGRVFTEAETTFQTANVVILTNEYWQTHRHRVGDRLRVDDIPHLIVGILPPGFRFLSSPAQLYFPYASSPDARGPAQRHNGNSILMVARIAPGASLGEAQAQIDAQNAALAPSYPRAQLMRDAGFRSVVASLHEDHVQSVKPTLLMLQAGALLLLLISVVNLVNLLLVRANGRMKELAVRQALGASARHIASEVMVETMLLTLAGGLLGCFAGAGGIQLLATLGADQLPLGSRIAFDARVAGAALFASVAIGALMSWPIAWFSVRSASLHVESRTGTTNATAQRWRQGFIVAQMALAFVLLAGAGLLALSLRNVLAVSPGIRPDHVLSGQIALAWNRYPKGPGRVNFVRDLARTIGQQPGILAAGIANNVPFSGKIGKSAAIVKGYVPRPGESVRGHYGFSIAGDYFRALGFTLVAGRFLTADDADRVCVVDEDFARHYWPDGNALGQRVFYGSQSIDVDKLAFTVVGVVRGVKQAGLTESSTGAIFMPYDYNTDNDLFIVARTANAPETMALALQRTVRSLDRDMPVLDIRSMQTRINDSLLTRRSPALLATLFAAIAVLLTAIGTYGVLSYAVVQRRREIAVRMALGARPGQIRGQFLRTALRLLTVGLTLGAVGAWMTGTAMQAVLFQVPAFSVSTLGAAAAVMATVCLIACLLPSQRAARTSPLEALAE
jgi:predicted permease